ncbi:TPA: conjugal transfer protein [Staphylococcus aureus]|nr:conjugal transfer protein [Staphylococcus aureus]
MRKWGKKSDKKMQKQKSKPTQIEETTEDFKKKKKSQDRLSKRNKLKKALKNRSKDDKILKKATLKRPKGYNIVKVVIIIALFLIFVSWINAGNANRKASNAQDQYQKLASQIDTTNKGNPATQVGAQEYTKEFITKYYDYSKGQDRDKWLNGLKDYVDSSTLDDYSFKPENIDGSISVKDIKINDVESVDKNQAKVYFTVTLDKKTIEEKTVKEKNKKGKEETKTVQNDKHEDIKFNRYVKIYGDDKGYKLITLPLPYEQKSNSDVHMKVNTDDGTDVTTNYPDVKDYVTSFMKVYASDDRDTAQTYFYNKSDTELLNNSVVIKNVEEVKVYQESKNDELKAITTVQMEEKDSGLTSRSKFEIKLKKLDDHKYNVIKVSEPQYIKSK